MKNNTNEELLHSDFELINLDRGVTFNDKAEEESKESAEVAKKGGITRVKTKPEKEEGSDYLKDRVHITVEELSDICKGPSILSWFITLMISSIPGVNIIYHLGVFLTSKNAKRNYAIAWLLANFLFLCITVAVIVVTMDFGVENMDRLLEYMEML